MMYRALNMHEFTVGEVSVQDAHFSTDSGVAYAESSCVTKFGIISVRTFEMIFEMGGSVTVSGVSMNGLSLMIGRARQAYSTSPRSAKVTNKSMLGVALRRFAGLKNFVEFADAINIVIVAPSFRSILGDGLRSRLQRFPTTTAAYNYRVYTS